IGAALAQFKAVTRKPKILIADTIKGRGVSFMEHTAMESNAALYRFHSGAPDQETYAKAVAELLEAANAQLRRVGRTALRTLTTDRPHRPSLEGMQRMVAAYSAALVKHAREDPRIVALDADLVLDCGLIPFKDQFPERFFECGIAEMDMVSQAGGMALRGLLPVVHSFACFLSTRPNEQIYNNATERTKIVYVGSLAGLLPAGPGHSHQCVRDISSLGAIPGLTLIEPADEIETALALDYCLNMATHSSYLRLVSIPCRIPYTLPDGYALRRGVGVTLLEGKDALVFGYGPVLLPQAFEAAQLLHARGISLKVVNLPWLNCVDDAWLRQTVSGFSQVFTLDNHYIAGGQGEMIAAALARLGIHTHVATLGVEDIPKYGQNDEALSAHRLDARSIADAIALSA
ncbi:MAG: transketolase, partial [Verrucomicrobiota bacterium]|nr:transketolase [Verrucomicrobiota bacterium]